MNRSTWGAVVGLIMAGGLLMVASWLRARRPMTVLERIGPFVGSASGVPMSARERVTIATAWSTLWTLVGPLGRRQRGPARPGALDDKEAVRLRRLTWSLAGAAAGACCAVAITHGAVSLPGVVLLGGIGALMGWLGSQRHDVGRARRRRTRIEEQLPVVADLLAFAVAAGESPLAALERVTSTSTGELSDEIRSTVADVRTGRLLDAALTDLGRRIGSAALQRFVDGLVIALERGTPIADVLRAQAADCRADERRRLVELAGRKDVLMLVPVVFLILPTVVLVALFPGIQSLRLVVS